MNSYLRLYAKPFYSQDVCSDHRLQINFLRVPPLKVCANCGQTESLSGNELYWPCTPAEKTKPLKVKGRTAKFKRTAYLALILAGLVLIKLDFKGAFDFSPNLFETFTEAVKDAWPSIPDFQSDVLSGAREPDFLVSQKTSLQLAAPVSVPDKFVQTVDQQQSTVESTAVDHEDQSKPSAEPMAARNSPDLGSDASQRLPADSSQSASEIETKITKAIRNRAISGVTVSFEKNTAFLAGQVKTKNQKSAAEQAALSVPEVKRLKSSIHVEWVGR